MQVIMRRFLTLCAATLVLAAPSAAQKKSSALECRQSNYITKDGKIFAEDPANPGVSTEINIKGVSWSGMEREGMIPDGLWGATQYNNKQILGTKMSTLIQFLSNNSFNSVRLPLNADSVNQDLFPQLAWVHGYENKELTTGWDDPNSVKYVELVGRIAQTFQEAKISVLLDIHVLDKSSEDALWYSAPYTNLSQTTVYKAVSTLASRFCNASYWNILGVDLKNEMTGAQWNADPADAKSPADWRGAAEILANRVVELCPQWLVFVGGAASPTKYQKFVVDPKYAIPSSHWPGGNLKNATKNPIKMKVDNKLVFAPHAHAHGRLPQNYFFTTETNCSIRAGEEYELEDSSICVDWIDGKMVRSLMPCTPGSFGCRSYKHLDKDKLVANYKKVLDEAMGDVVKEGKTPVVFGSLSGVYDAAFQPKQTVALDFLIEYAATTIGGGYFWSLNPDTEHYLEDTSTPNEEGMFGRTHFGIFKPTSWQDGQPELLTALSKIKSSKIPCYGEKRPTGGKSSATTNAVVATGLTVVATALSSLLL